MHDGPRKIAVELGKQTSGAKAHVFGGTSNAGDKSPAYHPVPFTRAGLSDSHCCPLFSLFHGVAGDYIAVPLGAQLGRAFEGLEVHIVNSKTLAVSIAPLEVVEQAPQEVALDGIAFRDGA